MFPGADGQAPSTKPLDIMKMLIFPAVLYFSKQIDLKDPDNIQKCQIFFGSVVLLILSVYFVIYQMVNLKNDNKVIYVPPKPQPKLPFGLGPEPEPFKPSDFTKTSYKEHETKQLKEAVQQLLFSAGISFFLGYKFQIYLSLIVQGITLPLNLLDAVLFKKYILGVAKNDDGSNLYHEQFTEPTVESIAIAKRLADARAAQANGTAAAAPAAAKKEESKASPSIAVSAIRPDEPRVEVLDEDEDSTKSKSKKDSKKEQKKTAPAAVPTTNANDID